MNHLFLEKLNTVKHDKNKLLELIQEIDQNRRLLKVEIATIRALPKLKVDNKIGQRVMRTREAKLRRMRDKVNYLVEERDLVSSEFNKLKSRQKVLNKIQNRRSDKFLAAFVAAAELELSEEQFTELEITAMNLMNSDAA